MNILEVFLKDMELDCEYSGDRNHCEVILPVDMFSQLYARINHNEYYYSHSETSSNKIDIKLRNYDDFYWVQTKITVEQKANSTVITASLLGYETVLPDGTVVLSDSPSSKNRLEV